MKIDVFSYLSLTETSDQRDLTTTDFLLLLLVHAPVLSVPAKRLSSVSHKWTWKQNWTKISIRFLFRPNKQLLVFRPIMLSVDWLYRPDKWANTRIVGTTHGKVHCMVWANLICQILKAAGKYVIYGNCTFVGLVRRQQRILWWYIASSRSDTRAIQKRPQENPPEHKK